MSISVKLPQNFDERVMEMAEKKAVRRLKSIGEECVGEAVENGNYKDKTGNLRSSIGYVVVKDGEIIEEGGFWNMGGEEGRVIGRNKAAEKAQNTRGLALIVVAGMKYAQYVSDKGFNVLDSAEIIARQLVAQLQ